MLHRVNLRSAALCGAAVLLALTPVASAQSIADGLRLFGPTNTLDSHLVDVNGTIVHTWSNAFLPGVSLYLDHAGSLVRTIRTPAAVAFTGGTGGGVQRLALDGTVEWDFRYDTGGKLSHHDIEILPNGNILMIAWEEIDPEDVIAAGRDPALLVSVLRPDHVIEVQPIGPTGGAIVWEWHVWDHLIQDHDPTRSNYGVVANHPELVDVNFPGIRMNSGDWNHCNSIDYDPVHDWILISSRKQEEIWIIDHSTTTQEAAGHTGGRWGKGGDLLYRWGNPRAYRAGTNAHQILRGQHSARFVPAGYPGAGNITIFNNNAGVAATSEVIEIPLPLDPAGNFVFGPNQRFGPPAPIWSISGTFHSNTQSSAERLPNGNTLICSAEQRLLLEVDSNGQVLWQHTAAGFPFHAHFVERALWANGSGVSVGTGGSIDFDVIAGSQHAGAWYLVLGSASGTTPGIVLDGQQVPLNLDGWMATTLEYANFYPFANTLGTLDGNGRALASLTLPGGLFPSAAVGLQLDHAVLILDPITKRVMRASHAIRIGLGY